MTKLLKKLALAMVPVVIYFAIFIYFEPYNYFGVKESEYSGDSAMYRVREFIKEMNKETKLTVILTTHDINDIDALTNRIILIGKGRKLYDGSFEAIKEQYSKSVTVTVQMSELYDDVQIDGYDTISINGYEVVLRNKEETIFSYVKLVQNLEKKYKIVDISKKALELEEVIYNLYKEYEL